jgi:MFS family permease
VGEIVFFPAQLAALLRLDGRRRGRNVALYQLGFSLAGFVAPGAGTALYAVGPEVPWLASAAIGCAVAAGFLTMNLRFVEGYTRDAGRHRTGREVAISDGGDPPARG